MPKILLLMIILALAAGSLGAESFRMGIAVAAELAGDAAGEHFFDHIMDRPVLFPGVYWEVMLDHIGYGMTYLGKFKRVDETETGCDWQFDWIGSMDLRYHFTKESFLDPFVEFGIGCAGRIEFPVYADGSNGNSNNGEPLLLSIFFQAGGGVAFRFDTLHAGIRLLYRIMNGPVPATSYDVYPLDRLEGVIFAGVSF